ncbi:MAG: 16S rRNA (cytosine(967)-C(5))-methyltransferase RsmB, partial [Gammaproteobacteria bacterium]|nr:16S rRNA (cytosine(967)-C(5))-methyltransferase RsmB [Gammaproteobacteria bacterium]
PPGGLRAEEAQALAAVLHHGRSLSQVTGTLHEKHFDRRDQALIRALLSGALRHLTELTFIRDRLMQKPLRERDSDVDALILLGIFQLRHMDVPDYAAIDSTVSGCRALHKPWASKLVNGVLRNVQRSAAALDEAVAADRVARTGHPGWLLDRLRADWGDDADLIVAANRQRAPLTLRVNHRQGSREAFINDLEAAGISNAPTPFSPDGVTLDYAGDITLLPGFETGRFSVQDQAGQLVAGLVAPAPGQRVLDACAAPGGKAAHLLERYPDIALTALDYDAGRMEILRDGLRRLGLSADCLVGDAAVPEGWWDGVPFDCILLDAPCSATGVIRRHPDILLNRRDADIAALNRQQQSIAAALWNCLKPGGHLVYTTCSVLKAENDAQVAQLLDSARGSALERLDLPCGRRTATGIQILPGDHAMDGFFFARLERTDVD